MVKTLLILTALFAAGLIAGCVGTVDPDQVNTQPWSTPAGWEGTTFGMPY